MRKETGRLADNLLMAHSRDSMELLRANTAPHPQADNHPTAHPRDRANTALHHLASMVFPLQASTASNSLHTLPRDRDSMVNSLLRVRDSMVSNLLKDKDSTVNNLLRGVSTASSSRLMDNNRGSMVLPRHRDSMDSSRDSMAHRDRRLTSLR